MVGSGESTPLPQTKGKLTSIPKPVPLKLKDLPDEVAEAVTKKAGFPSGSGKTAKAGWSGETEVKPEALKRLLSDAVAEAESQQNGK